MSKEGERFHLIIHLPKLAAKVKVCLALSRGDMTTAATTIMFPTTLTKRTMDINTTYSAFVPFKTVVASHTLCTVGVLVVKVMLLNHVVWVTVVMVMVQWRFSL